MGANGLVALGETQRGLEWADRALALDPERAGAFHPAGREALLRYVLCPPVAQERSASRFCRAAAPPKRRGPFLYSLHES